MEKSVPIPISAMCSPSELFSLISITLTVIYYSGFVLGCQDCLYKYIMDLFVHEMPKHAIISSANEAKEFLCISIFCLTWMVP